jgi:hypothetical protein
MMFKNLTFSLGLGAAALELSGAAMAHVDVGLNIGVPAPVYMCRPRLCMRHRQSHLSRALDWSSAGMATGIGTDTVIGVGAIGRRTDIMTIAAANFLRPCL